MTATVARNIEAIMEAKGLNAAEVARRAQLNPTAVYDIIKVKIRSPRIETLSKIANALGVPVRILFEDRADADLAEELEAIFLRLPQADQERLLKTAQAWLPVRRDAAPDAASKANNHD